MFDNLFSPSPAVWTALVGGLIALPLLIHLINLVRHQKVEWAAMEFLLKSYKKNKNWVWLKQFLLLLSRIGALLLALFMLGQVGCNEDRIARLLGGETTHHYVLLDDSFSMGDRGPEGTAFDRALATLSLIAARAENLQNQKFTLLRYSRSSLAGSAEQPTSDAIADVNGVIVDNLFSQRLEDVKSRLKVSSLASGVTDSIVTASELIKQRENENAIVYILSDFRAKDWDNPAQVEPILSDIHQSGAAIELINCVKSERPNLTISEMSPAGNVRVAGTPLMMRLTVKNGSNIAAKNVQVKISAHSYDRIVDDSQNPGDLQPTVDDLPTVFIEMIKPGKSESREFPVFFNAIGQHVIQATLSKDAVELDNVHWNITEFGSSARVLIIDDHDQFQGSFLALAVNPGGMTGIAPVIQTKDFLRDSTLDQLNDFDVIYLLDVDRLEETAVKNIESFAANGGGVGFFLGQKTDLAFYTNLLFRNGQGIFPMPLEKVTTIPEVVEERIPDIAAEDHPIFPPGMKNPLLNLVQIRQIVQPPIEWVSSKSDDITIAATVRGESTWPLIVQSRLGLGNVVVFTTTAGPVWNNWCRNGTFPPVMLLVEDLLAAGSYSNATNLVGDPIEINVPSKSYGPELTFVVPTESVLDDRQASSRIPIKYRMTANDSSDQYGISLGKRDESEPSSDIETPGVYDVWLHGLNTQLEPRRFALNVDSSESDMKLVNQQNLMASLDKSKPSWVTWDQFNPEPKQQSASSITKLLLIVLLALLVGEQLLAYSSSYHTRSTWNVSPTQKHSHKMRSKIPSAAGRG